MSAHADMDAYRQQLEAAHSARRTLRETMEARRREARAATADLTVHTTRATIALAQARPAATRELMGFVASAKLAIDAYNRALTDLNEHDRRVTHDLLDTDTPF
jgi:predicted  nucleic acid-binding Zn-ribbon protein